MPYEITINYDRPRGWIKSEPGWTYSALEKCKECPDKSRFINPIFWFERTTDNDEYFDRAFPFATKINVKKMQEEDEFLKVSRPPFKYFTKPDEQQLSALSMAQRQVTKFAFFEKPGFGKTKTILDHVIRLWCDGVVDCILIIAPNIVHEQWIMDEIPKHVHPSIPLQRYIYKSTKKLDKSIVKSDVTKCRILAMNIESVISKNGEALLNEFADSGKCAVIIDESHRIKNHSGKISVNLFKKRNRFIARFIATGTPDPLGLRDYFSQMRFLDPGIIGCKSFTGFKSKYCIMGGFENKEIRNYINTGELHEKMAPFVHVGEPVIDAVQIYEKSLFNLPDHARKIYDELKENYLVMLEDGRMASVQNQLSAIVRLQQLACGTLVLEDGTKQPVHNERMNLLKSLIGRYEGQKIVIWNKFTQDMEQQVEFLGKKAVGYWGIHSNEERKQAIREFLDPDSGVQYFVASPAAAGTGLNLQGSSWINIYYSNSDDYGRRIQSEYRTYRRGVKDNVLYIDIAARNTVDLGIIHRTRTKHTSALMSFNEFKSLIE